MKKSLCLLPIVFCLLILSCDNENITVRHRLELCVSNENLANNLVDPFDQEDFFPYYGVASGYQIATDVFIYDKDGDLVKQETKYKSYFDYDVNYSFFLESGLYTIISVVHIVYGSDPYNDYAWQIAEVSRMESAVVSMSQYNDQYGIIGYSKRTVELDEDGSSVNIQPHHLGALYVVLFDNIDYSKVSYIKYSVDLNPDSYFFGSDNNGRCNNYSINSTLNTEGKYTAYFTYTYLLPATNLPLAYSLYDVNNSLLYTGSLYLDVTKSGHQLVTIDVSNNSYGKATLTASYLNKASSFRNAKKVMPSATFFRDIH